MSTTTTPTTTSTVLKLCVSTVLILSSVYTVGTRFIVDKASSSSTHRRLSLLHNNNNNNNNNNDDSLLYYVKDIKQELKDRQKLFDDAKPNEVKYWFEYSGTLQRYYYRYSKSRKKADSFEGRDDSGVISSRFSPVGGGEDYLKFFDTAAASSSSSGSDSKNYYYSNPQFQRLRDNCLSLGVSSGTAAGNWQFVTKNGNISNSDDLCKVLFVLNTVGAGQGTTVLWETPPPNFVDEPRPWQSEQETAATHLERNLREMNAMCATGQIAARLQVLVCEPIPTAWTNWMDSLLVDCGGTLSTSSSALNDALDAFTTAENTNRYSPLQIVVASSPDTADTCHDLKSGFMERRMQDLILSVPNANSDNSSSNSYPKTSHKDLISTDDFDVYVGMKWTSLVTVRSLYGFLQASVDLSAAAASDIKLDGKDAGAAEIARLNKDTSPFLIPSFVRMSYVSEENNKVAKWRMHGDFFHPAGWEVCRDSFDMTWIPHSIAGTATANSRITNHCAKKDDTCGQWWIYFAEEQMPTSPDVFANENTVPIVRGGSNFVYMLTERHRREIVDTIICKREGKEGCGDEPQAVVPLGDMESFISNYTPNTALGKKHQKNRRPGYSRPYNSEENRETIRQKKKLKDQEDIEKALFDYTVYPAALMHKDATLKAARSRDATLSNTKIDPNESYGMPTKVKSQYYDVSIIKPRESLNGWCMSLSRRGLCTLYADYIREGSTETRCHEHCGLSRDWTAIENAQADQ